MSKSGESSTASTYKHARTASETSRAKFSSHDDPLRTAEGLGSETEWPLPSTRQNVTVGSTAKTDAAAYGNLEDSIGDLSEDIGPRTKHRKPKPKPGTPFKVLKARALAEAEDDEDDGDPLAQIAILPSEILARIFAHLDPRSITQCASVCKAFNSVVQDDSTWRLAVSIAFGIEVVDPRRATTPTMRRVDASSWRAEYTRRSDRVRRWRRARAPTVLTDARIELIHSLAFSLPHHFMLCASTAYGVASRCDPFTGKVSKGYLDMSGPVQGVPLVTLGLGPAVTALRLEADATRIVWGYQHGVVGLTTLARQGTNPRGAVRGSQFSARAGHIGPVTDIALPFGSAYGGAHSIERSPEKLRQKQATLGEASETFVTCGLDGTVRLWSPHRNLPLWKDTVYADKLPDGSARRPESVSRIAFHLASGTIAAVTTEGHVKLWTSVDVNGLLAISSSAFEEFSDTLEPSPVAKASQASLHSVYSKIKVFDLPPISTTLPEVPLKIDVLALDIGHDISVDVHDKPDHDTIRILTFAAGHSLLERRTVKLKAAETAIELVRLTSPGEDDSMTCVRPDFDIIQPSERLTNAIGLVTNAAATSATTNIPASFSARSSVSPLFAERKYVCAGTRRGCLIVWDWDRDADGEKDELKAYLCLNAHHASITAIDVTEHAIVLGSSDGTIKAFCPLSGQLLRSFNDRTATRHPARMLAAGQLTEEQSSRFYVTQIIASEETIVAAIGSQVLAWQAEKLRPKAGHPRKSTSRTGRNTIGRLWDPKVQSSKEMERDVYETQQELQQEHEERLALRQRLGGAAITQDLEDLTEQEAFEYAMMLSRDEMEAGGTSDAGSKELREALEQIAYAESGDDVHGYDDVEGGIDETNIHLNVSHDDDVGHGAATHFLHPHRSSMTSSHSSSPISSPRLRATNSPQSRAWDIVQNAGSSVTRNTRVGDAHSKVQSVHVPQGARTMTTNAATGSRRQSNYASAANHSLDSPDVWPSFDLSQSRSPTRLDLGSAVPTPPSRCPIGEQAHSSSPLPSSSTARSPLGGAWAHGSPSLRPVKANGIWSTPPSALSASRPNTSAHQASPGQSHSQQSEGPLDEDLRFALELSLAEERSRQEQSQSKGKGRE